MAILTATSIKKAVVSRIRKFMPTIQILRPNPQGELRPVTLRLNIFTENSETDEVTGITFNPDNTNSYPYIFVEQLDRHTVRRIRTGRNIQHEYLYFMNVRLYINIDPFDSRQTPRLHEELEVIELSLERILSELEMFDTVYETGDRRGTIQYGVLHYFFDVHVIEETVPEDADKVENLEIEDMEAVIP